MEHEVEFIIVGGVAAIIEGAPISTFDLDIVYRRTDKNIQRLEVALRKLNARYKDPAGRHIVPDATKLATIRINLLETDLGPLDLLVAIRDDLDYDALQSRKVAYELDGMRVVVASLETIIEAKELANRDKDRAALPVLRRTLEVKKARESP